MKSNREVPKSISTLRGFLAVEQIKYSEIASELDLSRYYISQALRGRDSVSAAQLNRIRGAIKRILHRRKRMACVQSSR